MPGEAKVVRRIYRGYLDGAILQQIKRGLEANGIPNGAKYTKWYDICISLDQILDFRYFAVFDCSQPSNPSDVPA